METDLSALYAPKNICKSHTAYGHYDCCDHDVTDCCDDFRKALGDGKRAIVLQPDWAKVNPSAVLSRDTLTVASDTCDGFDFHFRVITASVTPSFISENTPKLWKQTDWHRAPAAQTRRDIKIFCSSMTDSRQNFRRPKVKNTPTILFNIMFNSSGSLLNNYLVIFISICLIFGLAELVKSKKIESKKNSSKARSLLFILYVLCCF